MAAPPSPVSPMAPEQSDYEPSHAGSRGLFMSEVDLDAGIDDLDDNGMTGPNRYNESTERKPSLPAYDEAFGQVHRDSASMAGRVMELIVQSGCRSQRAQGMIQRARPLQAFPVVRKTWILLVGTSGAGMLCTLKVNGHRADFVQAKVPSPMLHWAFQTSRRR